MTAASKQLLNAIGVEALIEYFEFLDELRESGDTNMFGARPYLLRAYPGMTPEEGAVVMGAWMKTFSDIPADDRACEAIEQAAA